MGRVAQLTIAGIAGVAGLAVASAILGPVLAFTFSVLGLLLKIAFIVFIGWIVLTLLRRNREDDEEDDGGSSGPEASTDPGGPSEPIEVEVEEIEEDG